jgi:hypothetical protein
VDGVGVGCGAAFAGVLIGWDKALGTPTPAILPDRPLFI